MKYYKLSMDMERENDIICHFQNDYGIQQNALNTGKVFENWMIDLSFSIQKKKEMFGLIILPMIKDGFWYQTG